MDQSTAKQILTVWYLIRDLLVGWYFSRIRKKGFDYYTKWAKTPWRVWLYWQLGMYYKFDNPQYTQTPEETWKLHTGDCEDMAWFCYEQLQRIGHADACAFRAKTKEYSPFGTNGHVVALYSADKNKEQYKYMGTGLEFSLLRHKLRTIACRMVGEKKLTMYNRTNYDREK